MAVRDVSLLILYTLTGHILLQHRTDDALRLPGYWAFFGGGIEQGENATEALKREIREELSYLVQNPKFVLAQKVRDEENDCDNTKYVFEDYQANPFNEAKDRRCDGFYLMKHMHQKWSTTTVSLCNKFETSCIDYHKRVARQGADFKAVCAMRGRSWHHQSAVSEDSGWPKASHGGVHPCCRLN